MTEIFVVIAFVLSISVVSAILNQILQTLINISVFLENRFEEDDD